MKRTIIVKFSVFLLVGTLLNYWLLYLSPWATDIPIYIPGTPVNIPGLMDLVLLITVLILAQRQVLRKYEGISLLGLMLYGSAICFVSEFFFQAFRWSTLSGYTTVERLEHYFLSIACVLVLDTLFSFFVAFQLKTKKTFWLVVMIVVLAFGFNLLATHFPGFIASLKS